MVGFYQGLGDELSLYVRQLAWLNAKPERRKVSDKTEPRTRLEEIRAGGGTVDLPPNPARHIVDWLMEIGPAVATGTGEAAIGYRDIAAFQEVNGVEILPWEASLLRRLSRDFINQAADARKADCPPPYMDQEAVNRVAVDRGLRALFKGLAKAG